MEPQMPSSSLDTTAQNGVSPFAASPRSPAAATSHPPINTAAAQPSFSSTPAFPIKMEPEHLTQTEEAPVRPRKRGISYPFIGLITIAAGIVLAAEQYGLGNLIPYPLSGLIAAGLVTLVGLRLLAKGWLGRILAFWLGLAIVVVIGGMIYDTLYPGTLPKSGSRGITVGYDKEGSNLTLNLGTIPFSGSETVIVPPRPLEDYIMADGYEDEEDNDTVDTSMTGYTITVTGSSSSGTRD